MVYCDEMLLMFFYFGFLMFYSQRTSEQQIEQNNAAMELINSVTGVDEEGRSRQRILTFAARRYYLIFFGALYKSHMSSIYFSSI